MIDPQDVAIVKTSLKMEKRLHGINRSEKRLQQPVNCPQSGRSCDEQQTGRIVEPGTWIEQLMPSEQKAPPLPP
ncbi:hypothetical protein [Hydrogenophaga sp.]|uniref:hypothetical protein n=1 Tax=Hydrogenophaga sp. TaxID=1904254 RepID=UPI003AF72D42